MNILWIIVLSAHVIGILVVIRILLKPYRDPLSRVAWMFVVLAFNALGVVSYLLLGETKLKKENLQRSREIKKILAEKQQKTPDANIPEKYQRSYALASSINNNPVVGGNDISVVPSPADTIKSLIVDINAAKKTVHISFYIWLDDEDGLQVLEAVKQAAERGVVCRIMVDAIGSKKMVRRQEWKDLEATNIQAHIIFPLKHIFRSLFNARVDTRNHRKISVIDGEVTYCGSQNCCRDTFYTKPKYAPWVDIMLRVQGPLVMQNQKLFVSDWYLVTGEDISDMIEYPKKVDNTPVIGVTTGTGPSERYNAASHIFESVFQSATKELFIVTPYYVPSQALQSTLCALAEGGVKVRIIFPANNDSFVVGAASRSYYRELLEAGVEIHEYEKGLLHSKIAVVDGELSLIGSTNLDRRSFDLNYENNMLLLDSKLAKQINKRQDIYLKDTHQVHLEEVLGWSAWEKLKNNTMAVIGPLL